jgi:hypothetical protein
LLFNEQYNTKKVFLTISILSIPPLLADFVSSAIQSTITSIYSVTISAFICLQIIALVTLCLLFVSSFFVKESKQFIFKDFEFKKQIKQKKE